MASTRKVTAAQWVAANPTLRVNEIGVEHDTKRQKIGDGLTPWVNLPYQLNKAFADALYAPLNSANAQLPERLSSEALAATFASYVNLAKNPDSLIAGAVTLDGSDQVTSAVVAWPDGTPGTLTITARHSTGAVTAYNITYGSPVTKTFTQPAITRNANGAATNVPQIVVS